MLVATIRKLLEHYRLAPKIDNNNNNNETFVYNFDQYVGNNNTLRSLFQVAIDSIGYD